MFALFCCLSYLFLIHQKLLFFCCCKGVNRLIQHLHTFLIQAMSMARRTSVCGFTSSYQISGLLSLDHL